MSITDITLMQSATPILPKRSDKKPDSVDRPAGIGQKTEGASSGDPSTESKPVVHHQDFSRLQAVNDTMNALAKSVRSADKAMVVINKDYIEKMKEQLDAIIKNYPPFPPGSQERAQYLKTFSGLRSEIAELTIPPDAKTIQDNKVRTSPAGFDLPALSANSADAEIRVVRAKLDIAGKTLETRRAGLAADAAVASQGGVYADALASIQGASAEKLRIAELPDTAAEHKSVEVKQAFAEIKTAGITVNQPQLSQLLG